jgi:hypothetical protein
LNFPMCKHFRHIYRIEQASRPRVLRALPAATGKNAADSAASGSVIQRAAITPQATRLPELPAGCDL